MDGKAMAPNLFSFATSELSQDAMFAWMLSWADEKYQNVNKELCALGRCFIELLTGEEGVKAKDVQHVTVGRQMANIDIWVEVNDDVFLVIEDKTNTHQHDNQLERYKTFAETRYQGKRKIYCSYAKTGNESRYRLDEIRNKGYVTVVRENLLNMLLPYVSSSPIVSDYYQMIKKQQEITELYATSPVEVWSEDATWQGFYHAIDCKLKQNTDNQHKHDFNWRYVSNPSGGFQGAWWHFRTVENIRMYLQFEERKLCIKIECHGQSIRSQMRQKYHNVVMSKAAEMNFGEFAPRKPRRFAYGDYMTIAVVEWASLFFNDGMVDIDVLIGHLHHYEKLVDLCTNEA